MLDKKQIWAISLWNFLSSKCIVKQWRQLTASATHLALELLTNVQCSGGSRSFAKEIIALKIKNAVAGHWKLTTTSLRAVTKANPLTTTQKVAKEHSMVIQHLKQTRKVKKLGASWANHKSNKIIVLKCCLLFYATTVNRFSIGLWRAMKSDFIWPLAKTNSVIGPRRSSKAFPKAKLAPEKCRDHC